MDTTSSQRRFRMRRRPILERLEGRALLAGDFHSVLGIGGSSVLSASTAVDDAGNTVVVGNFRGTVDFDPGPKVANLSPVGVQAAFVAKYDPAGNYLWARAFTQTTGSGQAKGVAVGPGGVVYVVGNFTGAADFDPGSGVTKLTSAGGQDAFLVKLTSAGNFVWAQRWGGKANDSANAVAVDNNGRVGVGGSFSSVVDLDPGAGTVNATSRGLDDISAQVFTAAGDLVWAKNAGGTLGDIAHGAAFDNAGSLYLGGVFQSTVDFDPGPGVSQSSSVGGQDAFVWKLSGTGDHLWSRTWGNGYADSVAGLASDGVNVAAVGSFQGTLELGGVLVSRGLSDGYVVKLTGSGGVSWSTSFGAGSSDTASAVAADGMGNIYVAGSFQKTVDFAPGAGVVNLSSTGGGYDGFVVKLDSGGGYQWARSVGGVGYDVSTGVAVAGNGDVALTGRYSGPADFGSLRLPSVGKVNLFVSRIGLAAGGAMASFSAASASASAPSLASVSAPPSLALSRTIVPDTAARSLDLGATAAALRVGPRRGGNGRSRPVLVGSKVLGQSTL